MTDDIDPELSDFLARCDAAAGTMQLYRLDGARRVVRASMAEWMAMKLAFDDTSRVASDHVGKVWVSTVFLGLDMNHARILDETLPTLCFETLIGYPDRADIFDRYATWEEAEAGHAAAIAKVKEERQ